MNSAARRRPYAIAAGLLLAAAISSIGTALYLNSTEWQRSVSRCRRELRGWWEHRQSCRIHHRGEQLSAQCRRASGYARSPGRSLAPETVAQLKASLRTIDEAILEARNALARDPANKTLIEMLSGNYRQKVDLLRRTTEMTRGS